MIAIAQLTDLHLRPPGVHTQGTIDADRFTIEAIDAVLSRHGDVDAVVVSGDLTDLGEEDAYSRAAMLLSRFSMPVLVIPGNHDRTAPFREAFRTWPGIADEPVPGKVCHARRIGEVTIVSLDTSVDDPAIEDRAGHGELGQGQLAWLDGVLHAAGPVFLAMHHPPFAVGIDFMDALGLKDADRFAEIISRHDNVLRIVCGHVHRTIISEVGGTPAMAVPGVAHQVALALEPGAAPRIVMEPPAYAVHQIHRGRAISHVGYVGDYLAPEAAAAAAAPRRAAR